MFYVYFTPMDENFKNLHLQLSLSDISKIDLWKAKHGMKSRSEAIRSILRSVIDDDLEGKSSLEEKSSTDFLSPSSNNSDIKNIIRNLVKEEINKLNE